MKSVFAATCCRVVKRNMKIILAEEPAKHVLSFFEPAVVSREPVSFKTSRDSDAGLNWLLIEACLLITQREESIRPYGHKGAFVSSMLCRRKPFQCFDSSGGHLEVAASMSSKNE